MLPFGRGMERILKADHRPMCRVIPACIGGLWGGFFSHGGGPIMRKRPKAFRPRCRRLGFRGPPFTEGRSRTPATFRLGRCRRSIADPGHPTRCRAHLRWSIGAFVRNAAQFRQLFRPCVIDNSSGPARTLTWGKTLVGALCVTRYLRAPRRRRAERRHLAADRAWAGRSRTWPSPSWARPSVNLNYTAGTAAVRSAVKQAGLRVVVTSKRFVSRVPLDLPEDVERDLPRRRARSGHEVAAHPHLPDGAAPARLGARPLRARPAPAPAGRHAHHRLLQRQHRRAEGRGADAPQRRRQRRLGDPHHRHRAERPAASASCRSSTASATRSACGRRWRPAATAVYYPDPRQAKEVGELCQHAPRARSCSATATFLRFYLRRCEPDDFRTLRLIICGAEKLPVKLPGRVPGEVRRAAAGRLRLHGTLAGRVAPTCRTSSVGGRGAAAQPPRHGRPADPRRVRAGVRPGRRCEPLPVGRGGRAVREGAERDGRATCTSRRRRRR